MDAARLLRGRQWLAIVAVAVVAQLALVMALNLYVDPRAEFPTSELEPLVVDARAMKILTYDTLSPKPETLVFGSSRAMTISPAVLEAEGYGRTFNFAVDSGKATDALRAYEHAAAAGATPRRMVILAEDWAFRDAFHVPWPDVEGVSADDVPELTVRLVQSARIDYVQDSWRAVKLNVKGFPARDMAFQDDGTVVWEKADAAMRNGTYDEDAAMDKLLSYGEKVYDPAKPVGPEPAYVEAFEALLAAARENGTRLQLVLPPMTSEAASRVDADAYAASLAATRALLLDACGPLVQVHDFTDPASYGAGPEDYIDGFHPTREGGERLTRAIATAPDLCQQEI